MIESTHTSSRPGAPWLPLLAVALTCVVALPAAAYDYSTDILIDNEEDLFELYYAGMLEEEELERLLELLSNPLDVNSASAVQLYDLPGITRTTADAIVRHREEKGLFKAEVELITLPGIGDDVFEQMRPFLDEMPPIHRRIPVKGVFTLRTGKTIEDSDPPVHEHPNATHSPDELGYEKIPDFYLRGKVTVNRWLEMGFLGLAQEEIGSSQYNPGSHDFLASWGAPTFEIDKGYVSATGPKGSGIVGSYTAGYGRRITFDVTQRTEPHGWYPDLLVNGTERFRPPQRLFGGSARLTAARFGRSSLDMSLFASSRLYDLYQYHMGFEDCNDDDGVASPRIYMLALDGTLQRVGWLTLPNAYREDLLGGNFTFRINNRSHIGVTGYAAHIDKTTISGVENNEEWLFRYRIPNRDYFGAVGADFMFGIGPLALSGEYAHNDKSGNAVLMQANVSRPRYEADLIFRHYDTDYDNPHNRGTSAADVYEGTRSRDETGFRLKGLARPLDWFQVRGHVDLWRRPSTGLWNLQLYGKTDLMPTSKLRLSGFVRGTNKDLSRNERGWEYGGSAEQEEWASDSAVRDDDVEEEGFWETEGRGEKIQLGTQLDVRYIPLTTLSFYYQRFYEDVGGSVAYPTGDGPCEPWFAVGNYMWVKARVKPTKLTTITWRLRYLDEDVWGHYGERGMDTYLQLEQKVGRPPRPRVKFMLRLALGRYLADGDADWEYDCSIAGIPQLADDGDGTCLATDVAPDEEDPPEEKWYGQIWGAVEFRF